MGRVTPGAKGRAMFGGATTPLEHLYALLLRRPFLNMVAAARPFS